MSSISLSKRHAWMVDQVANSFALDRDVIENSFRIHKRVIDAFLQCEPNSSPRLFFQTKTYPGGSVDIVVDTGMGPSEKLTTKCFYFVRDSNKPVRLDVPSSNEVICGELGPNILESLGVTISKVYAPILANQDEWGKIRREKDKQPFLTQLNKLHADLQKKMSNLKGDLQLATPREEISSKIESKPPAYVIAAQNPDTVMEFRRTIESWCSNITAYLENDKSIRPLSLDCEEGPDVEIEYWSRRMLTLISVTEQLKTKRLRIVTGVLKVRAVAQPDSRADEARPLVSPKAIKELMDRWRVVDLAVTDSLNEAKDNVRFLDNLQNVIEPLYTESPSSIIDSIPALMNSMRMTHSLSRHYCSDVRMTNLFMRVTNQLITRCKQDIYGGGDADGLWTQDPDVVTKKMAACIQLAEKYSSCYNDTANELSKTSSGKQFNFDTHLIFSKFTRFRRRLEKLIDMYTSIKQFRALELKRIDGMEPHIQAFKELITRFAERKHDLLDFKSTSFERDFVEFTMHISGLEHGIHQFMESSISASDSVDKQLAQLAKFRDVLHREALQAKLQDRVAAVLKNYVADIDTVARIFEATYKDVPTIPRNMTKVAGCIQWSRQLLRRLLVPMAQLRANGAVLTNAHIAKYNRVCNQLVEYESIWFQAWQMSTENAKKKLRTSLIIRLSDGRLAPNFDEKILELMRDARHLHVMGFEIPNSAKMVLLLEEKLRAYYAEICHVISTYHRVMEMIMPITATILKPHVAELESKLAPAITTMTWTSLTIDQFLTTAKQELSRFERLIIQINDTLTNRIEKNIAGVRSLTLLNLPKYGTMDIKSFASSQPKFIEQQTQLIMARNLEVERAVNDLLEGVSTYKLSRSARVSTTDMNCLKFLFSKKMYHAIVSCVLRSIALLRKRLTPLPPPSGDSSSSSQLHDQALFAVDLILVHSANNSTPPQLTIVPDVTDITKAVYEVVRALILHVGKVRDWNLDHLAQPRPTPQTLSDSLTVDKHIAISLLVLKGELSSLREQTNKRLTDFSQFEWLWQTKVEPLTFDSKHPLVLDEVVGKLQGFVKLQSQIASIPSMTPLGAVNIGNDTLKNFLTLACKQWIQTYTMCILNEARSKMREEADNITKLESQLDKTLEDFTSLSVVMAAQQRLREAQSFMDARFNSIFEMYDVVEQYIEQGTIPKDEMDGKASIRQNWSALLEKAASVQNAVHLVQDSFKEDLVTKIAQFKITVSEFKEDYDRSGPRVPGLSPGEAVNRIKKYGRESEQHQRNYSMLNAGEKLYGLPESKYPALDIIRKDVEMLDALYRLHEEVHMKVEEFKNINWSRVVASVKEMGDVIAALKLRCQKLTPKNKDKQEDHSAHAELSAQLDDFLTILPLLTELSKPSMRQRHWDAISKLTGTEFVMEKFDDLQLKQVLDANLLQYKDEIEEITSSADKQLAIENKLQQIRNTWEVQEFEFSAWKSRQDVMLNGTNVTAVVELLEDSQSSLTQMMTQRQVAPFKEEVQMWLEKLSSVNEVLDKWIKTQQLWMSLEAVFLFGDISRQLPADTRTFVKWDKEWSSRLMVKAKDVRNVVDCCQNDYIRGILDPMTQDLEKCQKALDGYLEAKRAKFPRFYFVSNPALLQILSQGSDKEKVQQCFGKVFDAIDRVEFQGNNIVKMRSQMSGRDGKIESEDVPLTKPVPAKGNIEDWLNVLLREMARSIKDIIRRAAGDFDTVPLTQFVNRNFAQVALLGVQFLWTSQCIEAMSRKAGTGKGDSNVSYLLELKAKQDAVLRELSLMTLNPNITTKLERTKIETLVTIQVHQTDVIKDDLCPPPGKGGAKRPFRRDVSDFEWQKQLRCMWSPDDGDVLVKIADIDFTYSYEYLGCKERLVVTNLTDRCYISLSQALGLGLGGAPAGPAGTGKTETTKDLGRALGIYVVVFNCSDQMHTRDTLKLFKGICQAGVWGCFDEFNRIDLEVLSVVAQQVQTIFNGIRSHSDVVYFPSDEPSTGKDSSLQSTVAVLLDPRCGVFITMNPGYFGRQELPENLKALFRSVAMMVPDSESIMRVKLCSVGYRTFTVLSQRFYALYSLCEQQLSKQRHYDFGLRNILSVLRTAGENLRYEFSRTARIEVSSTDDPATRSRAEAQQAKADERLEEMIMTRTLRDMNLSKLVRRDVDLFTMLLRDIFPSVGDPPKRTHDQLEEALSRLIKAHTPKIIEHQSWVTKCIQLYESSLVRHGLMMIGPSGSGKTMATKLLLEAMTEVSIRTSMVRMNPKAITAEQMFGYMDTISSEWTDGVFSKLWEKYNDIKKTNTWLVCDGPVDAIWIENLNTVLDDNKILTLASGDRLPMTGNVRILFEAEDLRNASPATVSRAGIIFVSDTDLGWKPVFDAWLLDRRSATDSSDAKAQAEAEESANLIGELFKTYVEDTHLLENLTRGLVTNSSSLVISTAHAHLVTSLCNLMDAITKEEQPTGTEAITRCFLYALSWAMGGLLEADNRAELNRRLLSMTPAHFLPQDSPNPNLWNYRIDKNFQWEQWRADTWKPEGAFKFTSCLIPTADSRRAEHLLAILQKRGVPVLLTGGSGTAKSSVVFQYAKSFEQPGGGSNTILKKITFSSVTTHNMFQRSMEADLEKGVGKALNPPHRRYMVCFLDDLAMPETNDWGDQPTLEIVRQVIETGGFYSLEKDKRGDKMQIEKVGYCAAMTHPGGGRNDIPNRLKRHFFCINLPPPSTDTIDNIYGTMLKYRYRVGTRNPFQPVVELVGDVTRVTVEIWNKVRAKMLPTPSRFHYIFNMRDLSRVFQGVLHMPREILQQAKSSAEMQLQFLRLWRHEIDRVFSDKLINFADKQLFSDMVHDSIKTVPCFRDYMHFFPKISDVSQPPDESKVPRALYVNFLRQPKYDEDTGELLEDAPLIYEPAPPSSQLRALLNRKLAEYNEPVNRRKMPLVLFDDALEHVVRIARIIGLPRGSALLVGVGGSGRQSLTRLAAYLNRHEVFQVQLKSGYKVTDFLEDIRSLKKKTGAENKQCTWILTDFEILDEYFLEYVNALLATGEIAGLFPKDEREGLAASVSEDFAKENPKDPGSMDAFYRFFIDRVRDNLHIVLCFSPANEKFAERARRFPGLINNCTIDWFLRWPMQALTDVSTEFVLRDPNFKVTATADVESRLASYIANVHQVVTNACDEYFSKFRRRVYVTPKSYLAYVQIFKTLYSEKLEAISIEGDKRNTGLQRLHEAELGIEMMQEELAKKKTKIAESELVVRDLIVQVTKGEKAAAMEMEAAGKLKQKSEELKENVEREREAANKDLAEAMPYVIQAKQVASQLDIGSLTQVASYKAPSLVPKIVVDCVLLLCQAPLAPTSFTMIESPAQKGVQVEFVADSFEYSGKTFFGKDASTVLSFVPEGNHELINEETMELLQPYMTLEGFDKERTKKASDAIRSMFMWSEALYKYHIYSKAAKPKMDLVKQKDRQLAAAQKKLEEATKKVEEASQKVREANDELQAAREKQLANRKEMEETSEKMVSANNLILSLAGEKDRWTKDAKTYAETKKRLVGDCAVACAFVSYLGPFNYEFRKMLLEDHFIKMCIEQHIPVTRDLKLNKFLANDSTVANWNETGLPKDDLSVQNGILVTKAKRFPLLVDPQGQGLRWVMRLEEELLPDYFTTTTLGNKSLANQLTYCLEEGRVLIVEGLVKELDPMFDCVLDMVVMKKGNGLVLQTGSDSTTPYDDRFKLYLITKVANPSFSPELSAKTTIIDFSVTQKGLEDQLLSRVILEEQSSLEEQRQKLITQTNAGTQALAGTDDDLLQQLSNPKGGNLLEDKDTIKTLADTKERARQVAETIEEAKRTEEMIDKKREQYRPIATRGSVVYFVIVSLAQINCMYQNSLDKFLEWFDESLKKAEKANNIGKRVENIMNHLTFNVYKQINQGLFEVDKLTFKLMVTLRILQSEGEASKNTILTDNMVQMLLHGGASFIGNQQTTPGPSWLPATVWQNVAGIAQGASPLVPEFKTIDNHDTEIRSWYESEAPETLPVPRVNERLTSNNSIGPFLKLLVIRSFRPDRMRNAASNFVEAVLGKAFVDPLTSSFDHLYQSSAPTTPIILLLTPGADPTSQLDELSRRKGIKIYSVSMGEGQEEPASKAMKIAMETGAWTLLQNCHLGLGFMNRIESIIADASASLSENQATKQLWQNFRLWITCEPHPNFPISLLQMSIKVTNEPPRGMKAGMLRSYTSLVDQKLIGSFEGREFRDAIFATCYLHSAVQERRKFGPIGWSVPYEFSTSDLEASLKFLEKHISMRQSLAQDTVKFMICQVQYGGRITDESDRRLFNTLGDMWLFPPAIGDESKDGANREFSKQQQVALDANGAPPPITPTYRPYTIPGVVSQFETHEDYLKFIRHFSTRDVPEIFGLHSNADLIFGENETKAIFDAIADTMPKQVSASAAAGPTREAQVERKAKEMLENLPREFTDDFLIDRIKYRPRSETAGSENPEDGFSVPLNMFLYQELTRLMATTRLVKKTLRDLISAINGEIIMTPQLTETLHAIYQQRAPTIWFKDASQAVIAWEASNLASWHEGLLLRADQLSIWLIVTRPYSFWLTGFYNPQGFLTAARQELTRAKNRATMLAAGNNAAAITPFDEIVTRIVVVDHPTRNLTEAGAYFGYVSTMPVGNNDNKDVTETVRDYQQHPRCFKSRGDVNNNIFIHGLYLEGAAYPPDKDNAKARYLRESAPREVYTLMPVMHVQIANKRDEDQGGAGGSGKDAKYYDCPVYTKKRRTQLNYVAHVKLRAEKPQHWIMRGVALLCSKD